MWIIIYRLRTSSAYLSSFPVKCFYVLETLYELLKTSLKVELYVMDTILMWHL